MTWRELNQLMSVVVIAAVRFLQLPSLPSIILWFQVFQAVLMKFI